MSNYMHTTDAGTSRRRAKSITINNPAQPLTPPEPVLMYDPNNPDTLPVMKVPEPPVPSVTFVMEDRVIMADGSEMFIPAGNLIRNLDAATLAKLYPSVNAETGEINQNKQRLGGQLMSITIDALEDFFITEGMAHDAAQATE